MNPDTQADLAERLERDSRCEFCGGTGRRGRGTCRKCHGSGIADMRHPQARFNSGFHTATYDRSLGCPLNIVESAEQGQSELDVVSRALDWWYAAGYAAGLEAEGRPRSSDPAWHAFLGRAE